MLIYGRHRSLEFGLSITKPNEEEVKYMNVILLRFFLSFLWRSKFPLFWFSFYLFSFTTLYLLPLSIAKSIFFSPFSCYFEYFCIKKSTLRLIDKRKMISKISFISGVNKPILQNELNNDHLIIIFCCVLIHF